MGVGLEVIGTSNNNTSSQKAVYGAWENFISGGECVPSVVSDVIKSSWQRSLANGVGPSALGPPVLVKGDSLKQLQLDNRDLHAALENVEEHLSDILEETKSMLLLADSNGVLMDVFGNSKLLGSAKAEAIAPGSAWSENVVGTNAIGTAIALKQAVEIHAAEHFCESVKIWSCSAVPILDYLDGDLLGVIDVTTLSEQYSSRSIGLAIAMARQIEEQLHSRDLIRCMELVDWFHDTKSRWANNGVILLDRKGRVLKVDGNAKGAIAATSEGAAMAVGTRLLEATGEVTLDDLSFDLPDTVKPVSIEPIARKGEWQGGMLVLALQDSGRTMVSLGHQIRTHVPAAQVEKAFATIVSNSEKIAAIKERARRFAMTQAPVLIQGETGCGKELFSSAIHQASSVLDGPFVAINCGGLVGDLVASELFGYESGAFTGASSKGRPGKFEEADGGTLFLDEIGELPLDTQVILLRVLQDGVVMRLGSSRQRKINVRVIAATNRNLEEEVKAGRFRRDLYYRLKVMTLSLPPLREHVEDIEMLANTFLAEFSERYFSSQKSLDPETMTALCGYQWPGNVRELRGVLESMFVLSDDAVLTVNELPEEIAGAALPATLNTGAKDCATLSDLERLAIENEIERQAGNLSKVAQQLGIARSTLYRKMDEYQIDRQ